MDYNIYLDESGNTGDIKIEDGKWNWGNQPYFALGSICIESNKESKLYNDLKETLNSFQKGLGIETELKGKANYKFKKELTCAIIDILQKYNAKVYIDISNKKFKIATYIVEYCIYPYYFYMGINKDIRDKKVNAANRIYNIDENILEEFINLCYSDRDEVTIKSNFINFLDKLSKEINSKEIKENINNVKKNIIKYEEIGLNFDNLLPIVDRTNKGAKTIFLPNLDAYLNIISSTATIRLRHIDNLKIYHDEQKQFGNALEKWTEDIKLVNEMNNIDKIQFEESKRNILIQTSDFITGVSVQIFNKVIMSQFLSKKERELIKSVTYLLSNCNIVCPRYEQAKFSKQCGVKLKDTLLPRVKNY